MLPGMRYKGIKTGKQHDAHKAFVEQRVYDDRQIAYVAGRKGLVVTRPNGARRYRGSRRLCVVDPATRQTVWQFAAYQDEAPSVVTPVVVGRF